MLLHCLFIINISIVVHIVCESENIYLNSYKSCGREMYEVSLENDYVVKPDITADLKTYSFRDCEVTFHSHREHGRICLMQTGKVGRISDANAQLEARDGLGDSDDRVIEVLSPYQQWTVREYCSIKPYITLYLKEIKKTEGADISKVNIEFKVVDIESTERKLYLDGHYCNKQYKLLNSMVTLVNRPQFIDMAVKTLTSECGIRFDRIGGQRNTSICFAYVPSKSVDCGSHWRFAISVADFSLEEKYIKYSLKCNDTRASKIHVWCAEPTVSFVTVLYWRSENVLSNSSIEASKMFRYIVKDHKGSEQSFFDEVLAMFAVSDADFFSEYKIYVITASSLGGLGLIIVMCVCYQKRMKYKSVEQNERSGAV